MIKHAVIIPAKANSSRVRKKNFREFYRGKSLVDLTLSMVSKSSLAKQKIILSTDNTQYFNDKIEGLEIHARNSELCTVEAPILSVLIDIIKCYKLETTERILLIQPTSPFRRVEHLEEFCNLIYNHDYDKNPSTTFLSVYKVVDAHPARMYLKDGDSYKSAYSENLTSSNSQDLPACYHRNGCFYSFSTDDIMNGKLYSDHLSFYDMDLESSINIDTPLDFNLAKLAYPLFAHGKLLELE